MNRTVLSLTLSAIMLLSALSGLIILTPSVDAEEFCKEAIAFHKSPGANPEEMGVFQPVQVSWHADPGYDTGHISSEGLGKYEPTNDITFDGVDAGRNPVWTSTLIQIADKNTLLFNYDRYNPGASSQNIQDIYATRNDDITFQVMNYYTTPQSVKVQFVIKPRDGVIIHESSVMEVPACSESAEEPGAAAISIPVGVPATPFQFKDGDLQLVAELVSADGAFYDKITLNVDVKKSIRTKEKPFKVLVQPFVFQKDYELNAVIWKYETKAWLTVLKDNPDNSNWLRRGFDYKHNPEIRSFMQAAYPLPEGALEIQYAEPYHLKGLKIEGNEFRRCSDFNGMSEDRMTQFRFDELLKGIDTMFGKGFDRIVAVVPDCMMPGAVMGDADPDSAGKKIVYVKWRLADKPYTTTAAVVSHEVGHTFHSPSKLEHGYVTLDKNTFIFKYLEAFGYRVNDRKEAVDDHWGFMSSIPSDEFDFWVTKENYVRLLETFTKEELDPTVATISGVMHRNSTFGPSPSWTAHEGIPDPWSDTPSNYSIQTVDSMGWVLNSTNVSISFSRIWDDIGVVQTNVSLLYMTILLPAGTVAIRIVNNSDGSIIYQRSISDSPPTVTIIEPTGGSTLAKGDVVSWSGSDLDGDPLLYSVRLSADDGGNWSTIVANTENESVLLTNLALGDDGPSLLIILHAHGELFSGLSLPRDRRDAAQDDAALSDLVAFQPDPQGDRAEGEVK